MSIRVILCAWMCVALMALSAAFAAEPGKKKEGGVPESLLKQDWYPKAPPLPEPKGEVVKVKNVAELYAAVARAKPGQTIMVADGTYRMRGPLMIRTNKLTVRGESGDPWKCRFDFHGSNKGVSFSRASDCTLANVMVENVRQNGIKINSDQGIHRIRIYNCIGHNVWQRHVKGVRAPMKDGKTVHVEDCRVEYCLFYNDRPKRRGDDPYEDRHGNFGFNYVGGMDVMGAKGWVVANNVFIGIHGKTGGARGAIFMWNDTTDCLIENNIMINCDRGICLGNGHRKKDKATGKVVLPVHDTRMIVRNNMITGAKGFDVGILLEFTKDCQILNNTVHDTLNRSRRGIRIVQDNDGLVVKNNIMSGKKIRIEKHTGTIKVEGNLEKFAPDYFVDGKNGNLRLTAKAVEAIDKAVKADPVETDIDGTKRGEKPDLGAHEYKEAK
jgi:copper-binding protein NosD